eukprot:COSAG02_NODE_239_length_27693_cov_31.385700_7_plen_98_part_00
MPTVKEGSLTGGTTVFFCFRLLQLPYFYPEEFGDLYPPVSQTIIPPTAALVVPKACMHASVPNASPRYRVSGGSTRRIHVIYYCDVHVLTREIGTSQ